MIALIGRTAALAVAARCGGGPVDLLSFAALLPQWQQDGALEIEFLEQTAERFDFNVTRCRYAEMYAEIGVEEIGGLLSYNRDGEFCRGYDPDIQLTRTQTIMDGATHCDFRHVRKTGGEE